MRATPLLCLVAAAASCGDHNVDLGTPRSDFLDAGADSVSACDDLDGDGFGYGCARGTDCDEGDRTRYTGAPETCNDVDDDCDGSTDEGLRTACDDCSAFCFVTVFGDGEPIVVPGADVSDVGLDDDGDIALIPGGTSTGSYAMVVTGCPEDTTWFRAEWRATVPTGASLSLTLRAGDDDTMLDTAPAIGPYATSPVGLGSIVPSIYVKMFFDFAASPAGESPVLHDFRVVWECEDLK